MNDTSPQLKDIYRRVSRRKVLSECGGIYLTGLLGSVQAASQTQSLIQPIENTDAAFIKRAFNLRNLSSELGDQAYGAVIVHSGKIIGESMSRVILDRDPTAHAEMSALRDAAERFGSKALRGAILYSSNHPCSMCQAAADWVGIASMIYGHDVTNGGPPQTCG